MTTRGLSRRQLLGGSWRLAAPGIARLFHRVWYESGVWHDVEWQGVRVLKNPLDMWNYQEIVHETRPGLIIETGTFSGGSALFFAHLLDIQGSGSIVSVDVEERSGLPRHPRVSYLTGSSTDDAIVEQLTERARRSERVMVVLDSNHACDHVAEELRRLAPLVTPGCYLVVEDTNVNGHPVHRRFGPGPMEAVKDFLAVDPPFRLDARRERFLFTFNPSGWLLRTHVE